MAFCFTFSAVAVFTATCLVIQFGLTTGGPVVMIWGWLISSIFMLCQVNAMAEICSAYPGVGSVYYWTAMLSPWERWTPFLTYICGWFNLIGCVAFDASLAQALV